MTTGRHEKKEKLEGLIVHRSLSGKRAYELRDSKGLMYGSSTWGVVSPAWRDHKMYNAPKLFKSRRRAKRKLARRERWLADNTFVRITE